MCAVPPLNMNHDQPSAIEHAVVGLLREVLTIDERQLLSAFEAIQDPKVRRSLLQVACAAAGLESIETVVDVIDAEDLRPAPPPAVRTSLITGDATLLRVRRQLFVRASGKGRSF